MNNNRQVQVKDSMIRLHPIAQRFLLLATLFWTTVFSAQETDPASGLIKAEGWEVVQSTCTECHAALLITQNAGNRSVWESRIRWMQETQGLRLLATNEEQTILDYLASNYPQKAATRRAALPAQQMPGNPYEAED